MTRNEIDEKVKAFLVEDLEVEEENITPDARLKEDLGIDSLDFVDIVVIVERTFGFKIKPEEMAGVQTLSQFCEVFGPERECSVAREISKLHEEHVRGTLAEVLHHFCENEPKGEIVIIVSGKKSPKRPQHTNKFKTPEQ